MSKREGDIMSAENKRRRVRCITLAPWAYDCLREVNASRYIEALLEHYPPPHPATLPELAALVRAGHPWACQPGTLTARHGLPAYGGEPPRWVSGVASWDDHQMMTHGGALVPRPALMFDHES